MKSLITLTSILLLLAVSSVAQAGIRPSFSPEASSWRATDIVVVTEGSEIDGVFKVIETWKGDLKPGESISIPELGQFKTKEARALYSAQWREKDAAAPQYVSGDRMILFLRDAEKVPDDPDDDENQFREPDTNTSRWKSTNPMGREMKYSTAWIENGKVYCFVQIMNPGDSVLVSYSSETELKTEVDCVVSTQTGLNAALVITDLPARAESLEPFAKDSIWLARDRAFAGLVECGDVALPVLRRMLANESLGNLHSDVVEAFAKAGGKAVGPELTTWLEKEVEFWKRTAPTLRAGWWNGEGFESDPRGAIEAVEPLRTRYSVLLQGIYAIGAIRYTPAERVLIEINNLTRTVPSMDFDQITHACDQTLRDFGSNRKGLLVPKYEIQISGNKAFPSSLLNEKIAEYVAAYDKLEKDWEGDLGGGPVSYATHKLLSFYSSHGYLNAGYNSEGYSTERGALTKLRIDEGKPYRLGKIRITGSKLISPERIRAMLTLREGDVADGEAIHNWLHDDLEKIYHDLGYLNYYADDDKQYRVDPQGRGTEIVDFNIKIEERSQYRVEAIKFAGKSSIPQDRLIRAMSLREGEIFSQKQLDDSIEGLNKLGLSLDKDRDVKVSENHARERVTIRIVLDDQARANELFNRFGMKRSWYR